MNFELLLRQLIEDLNREGVRYGVIGGFALGALGVPRGTMDFDLLVHREDLVRMHDILTALGYERVLMTENVSHYRHPDSEWGSVDLLHAFRAHSLAMLTRTKGHAVFGGSASLHVLESEDIIGLKIQAMANDPTRRARETADIESLMAAHGAGLDWPRVLQFFELFGLEAEGHELERQYGPAV